MSRLGPVSTPRSFPLGRRPAAELTTTETSSYRGVGAAVTLRRRGDLNVRRRVQGHLFVSWRSRSRTDRRGGTVPEPKPPRVPHEKRFSGVVLPVRKVTVSLTRDRLRRGRAGLAHSTWLGVMAQPPVGLSENHRHGGKDHLRIVSWRPPGLLKPRYPRRRNRKPWPGGGPASIDCAPFPGTPSVFEQA